MNEVLRMKEKVDRGGGGERWGRGEVGEGRGGGGERGGRGEGGEGRGEGEEMEGMVQV